MNRRPANSSSRGLVLVELVLVFFIIALLFGFVAPDAVERVRQIRLDDDVAKFARTLRTTADLAVLYGRQLDVTIDVRDGYYTIYDYDKEEIEPNQIETDAENAEAIDDEILKDDTSKDDSPEAELLNDESSDYEIYDEEILDEDFIKPLIQRQGLDKCYIEQIDFPDGTRQYSGELTLYATPHGWGTSVVFHLIDDRNQRRRYVRCDRLTNRVTVSRRPIYLPEPLAEVSMTRPI